MKFFEKLNNFLAGYEIHRKLNRKVGQRATISYFFEQLKLLVNEFETLDPALLQKTDIEQYLQSLNQFFNLYEQNLNLASRMINVYTKDEAVEFFLAKTKELNISLQECLAEIYQQDLPDRQTLFVEQPARQANSSTWVDVQNKITQAIRKPKKGISVGLWVNRDRNFTILGYETGAHITIEVFDSEKDPVSVFGSFVPAQRSNERDVVAEFFRIPKRGDVPGTTVPLTTDELYLKKGHAFVKRKGLEETLAKIRAKITTAIQEELIKAQEEETKLLSELQDAQLEESAYENVHHYYTDYREIVFDCEDGQFDTDAVRDAITKAQQEPGFYNFYRRSCAKFVNDMFIAGVKNGEFREPTIVTPFTLFYGLQGVVSQKEKSKFNKAQSFDQQTWQDLFDGFAREQGLLGNIFLNNYVLSKAYSIKIPNERNSWFNLEPNISFENFILHLQILSNGLAQKGNIGRNDMIFFRDKIVEHLQRFDELQQYFIFNALESIYRKLANTSALQAESKTCAGKVRAIFSSENSRLKLAASDINLDTIFNANEFSDQADTPDITMTMVEYTRKKNKNNTLKTLDAVLRTVKIGLNVDGTPYQQIVNARYAILGIYEIEDDQKEIKNGNKNPSVNIKLSAQFYTDNRNILRQYLGFLYEQTYFADNDLVNLFSQSLNGVNEKNQTISSVIDKAIEKLSSGKQNRPVPSIFKFWKWNERSTIIYENTCVDVYEILRKSSHTGLLVSSPYQKEELIRNLLRDNRPNPFFFWRKKQSNDYNAIAQKAELILITNAFREGYLNEENFILSLKKHEKKYPSSVKISDVFLKKHIETIKTLPSDDETTTKLTAYNSGLKKENITRHLCSPAYDRAVKAARKLEDIVTKKESSNAEKIIGYKMDLEAPNQSRLGFNL